MEPARTAISGRFHTAWPLKRHSATPAEPWALTSLREKLIKSGARLVSRGRYMAFQMAEVAMSRPMFADILSVIARVRAMPAPA